MEIFDLYNEDRQPLGKTIERDKIISGKDCRLTVHVCLFNSKNQMLIQQRQSFKKNWPNFWDISVGGCVSSGETTKQAGEREVFEELGIKINLDDTRPFFTINFDNGFDDFYFLNADFDISKVKLQKEEVQNAKWATREEVQKLVEENKFIPYYDFFAPALFDIKQHRGLHKPQ